MGVRRGHCTSCRAPKGHPSPRCPMCGKVSAHLPDIVFHVAIRHNLGFGTRPTALVLDIARAQIRGWPVEIPRAKALREGIPVEAP